MLTKRVLSVVILPLLLALVACSLPSAAFATSCPLITVNENGQGTLDFSACGSAATPLVGVLRPDPGPGGLASVLTYNLLGPPSLVAGDVLMQDGVGGPILDVVRFNPAGTGGSASYPASLLFYSDNVDGFDSLGDTPGPPGALYTNVVTVLEVGPEGSNGAIYTPTAGQPGFVSGFTVSYSLISDQVPEPGTLSLFGSGLLGFAAILRRRVLRG